MISCILKLAPATDESWESYRLRRGRECGTVARRQGLWSHHTAQRIMDWSEHIHRNHNNGWSGMLFHFMGSEWFMAQRIMMNSVSALGGRTGTRYKPGGPRTRFHDGVKVAKAHLE